MDRQRFSQLSRRRLDPILDRRLGFLAPLAELGYQVALQPVELRDRNPEVRGLDLGGAHLLQAPLPAIGVEAARFGGL